MTITDAQPAGGVETERLEEILAGCEGVTPGPWKTRVAEFVFSSGEEPGNICACGAPRADGGRIGYTPAQLGDDESAFNAFHIARLDPQTVASIITELLAYHRRPPADAGKAGPRVRFVRAQGLTLSAMQDHVRNTPLFAIGDATLVWVNEGDFWLLSPEDVSEPAAASTAPAPADAGKAGSGEADRLPGSENLLILDRYDDGSQVELWSYAGGGAKGGAWSSITLAQRFPDGKIEVWQYDRRSISEAASPTPPVPVSEDAVEAAKASLDQPLTAIDRLRLHVHDETTFERPDDEDILDAIDAAALPHMARGDQDAGVVPNRLATWHALDDEGHAELRVRGKRITTFASYPAASEAADRINSVLIATPTDQVTALVEALRDCHCPRPVNGKPYWTTIGECIDCGECGCLHKGLTAKAPSPDDTKGGAA